MNSERPAETIYLYSPSLGRAYLRDLWRSAQNNVLSRPLVIYGTDMGRDKLGCSADVKIPSDANLYVPSFTIT